MVGRLILLKAAIESLPRFWFNLHRAPETVLKELKQIRRHFLWGASSSSSTKLHLLKWEEICKPKLEGGLGLIPLKTKNLGMLAKWWWRLYFERDKLWNKIMSQRYGANLHYAIGDSKLQPNASHLMLNLVKLRAVMPQILNQTCFRWSLHNGRVVYFWED